MRVFFSQSVAILPSEQRVCYWSLEDMYYLATLEWSHSQHFSGSFIHQGVLFLRGRGREEEMFTQIVADKLQVQYLRFAKPYPGLVGSLSQYGY